MMLVHPSFILGYFKVQTLACTAWIEEEVNDGCWMDGRTGGRTDREASGSKIKEGKLSLVFINSIEVWRRCSPNISRVKSV